MNPMLGRRIYIHEGSFDYLARTSNFAAEDVSTVLAMASSLKVVHHQIVELGVELGMVDGNEAAEFETRLRERFGSPMTSLLRRVGFRPRIPSQADHFNPVLDPSQAVVASCYDSGYFTFASDEHSSRRMFADHARLRDLWVAQMLGSGDPDLVMIKGRSLAYIVDGIPTGPGQGVAYGPLIKTSTISDAELSSTRKRASRRVVQEVYSAVAALQTADPKLISDVVSCVERAVSCDSESVQTDITTGCSAACNNV